MIDAPSSSATLSDLIKAQALGLGFDLVGIARTGPVESAAHFDHWLERGYAGTMKYLARYVDVRHDSRLPFERAESAIVVALDYGGRQASGPIARYARGDDYHDVMREMLDRLHQWIEERLGRAVRARPYVDTGPILERDLARKAGLGWFGKNTNLINPERGSFFFLGALLAELALEPDTPFEADRCGTCTRCIEACPTQAITEPRSLDATRCISYLTIELRDVIPVELREPMGSLLYGCDVCQDVCPYNVKFSSELQVERFAARGTLDSSDARAIARHLLELTPDTYAEEFRGSPMKRAKLRGLQRNAAVVLGNIGAAADTQLLRSQQDDLVREHAEWAIEQIAARES